MLSVEQMIVEKWNSLPADGRSVRQVQAALEADGVSVGRTSVHKAITAHKKGVAREIVVEDARKAGETLEAAARVAITPEAAKVVMERTGSVLDKMEALAASLCEAAIYSLSSEHGRPANVAEIATITTAVTGLGDMLTRAHLARNQAQATRDELERRVSSEPAVVQPAPSESAASTPLARSLRALRAEETGA